MTITDEPGYYQEGVVGIRIENELVCIKKMETEYGIFFGFEPITYCPIDTTPIITEMLQEEEIKWLNDYHALVFEKLSPMLTDAEKEWLRIKTKKIVFNTKV